MKPIILAIAICLSCTGCAIIPSTVEVVYQSAVPAAPVLGAQAVSVIAVVTDDRKGRPDLIGVKKNGYGMEMADIRASRPVAAIVQEAVIDELRKKGFTISPGRVQVLVGLTKLSNDFKMGFFSGDAVSEVILSVQVKGVGDRMTFAKTITGDNSLPGVMIMEGHNAKASVEPALTMVIAKLMNDPAFIQAIVQANAPGLIMS